MDISPKHFGKALPLAANKKDDTFFVTPPLFIQRIIFTHFGKTGLKKGFKGIYENYSKDSFRKSSIEQLKKNFTINFYKCIDAINNKKAIEMF